MSDPLEQIEQARANESLGAMAMQVYRGARAEAECPGEAFWATVAALMAAIRQTPPEDAS